MTIAEAISRADAIKPNRFKQEQKIEWLERIEGQIYQEMILVNDNPEKISFAGFPANVDVNAKLIAPAPYDDVYPLYLQCQIDLGNAEAKKYNVTVELFNTAYATLKEWWKRTHMPVVRTTHFRY